MRIGTWRVKAYIEYEIEAATEEEAKERLSEVVMNDLEDGSPITDIAEVNAEKISDTGFEGK